MQLLDELFARIESIPAIDVHSNIRSASPASAFDIVFCPEIQAELKSAGVARRLFEDEGGRDIGKIAPHLAKISNTATFWCLRQILHDLYDISGAWYETDISGIAAQIEKASQNPNWTASILDKAKVSTVLVTCDWQRPVPKTAERFVPMLRVESLVNEAFTSKTLDRLSEITDMTIYEAGDLKKAVSVLLEKAAQAGTVGICASFNPQIDLEEGNRDATDRILSLVMLGQKTSRDDRRALRSFVMDQVLAGCAEYGIPFQLMLGVRRPMPGELGISGFETGMMAGYVELFARHPRVKFDVLASNETLAHELAVVARNYPNVYASGYWRYTMFPTHIRRMIRERVEMLGQTKSNGFFSDACSCEWVYGRSRLIRHEVALTLSEMVNESYLSIDAAVEVAKNYLSENPKAIYNLK